MTKYHTNNALGSTDPRDLFDNAQNLDVAVNDTENDTWKDRFGRDRKTLKGYDSAFQQFLINSGYQNIGDYGPGLEITARNQIFWRDGELYRAGAALELPYTTTGDWGEEEGLFVAAGDEALRQELTSTQGGGGASFVRRNVIAIDSVADMMALPDSAKREDLMYVVKGYYADSDLGGGVFYWDPSREGENDGGGVLDGFVRIPTSTITPRAFGATPEVPESQTDLIQAAMEYAAENGIRLVIDGSYYVSATTYVVGEGADAYALKTPSNLDMYFNGKGELIQIGAPYEKSSVILILHASNVRIWFPRITGTRLTEDQSLPEQNHGIRILECEDVILYKPKISNTMGDGIYLGRTWIDEGFESPVNVLIYEPVIDRVRRNGISCCAWGNVRIVRPTVTNVRDIDGVSALFPKAGIDIEPESAGTNHADRIRTRGLYIESPTLLDCVTPFIAYYQRHSIGQEITVDITGTMRIRGEGEGWAARPFAIQNMGVNCTGWLNIERIIDESPNPSPEGGIHWGAILQNNATLESGLFVTIDEWIVKNQTSGIYAFVAIMLDLPDIYSFYQGNMAVRNIQLPRGVVGRFGSRMRPEILGERQTRNFSMQISYENMMNGYPGIINTKNLNTGVLPQGPNCYFDGVVSITSSLTDPLEIYGNRFALGYNSGSVVLDITEKVGTYEVIRNPVNSSSATIGIKGISLGSNNAFRSSSSSAAMKISKTGTPITTSSVIESHGEWDSTSI